MSRYIDIEPYEKDGWYLQKRYHNEYCEVVKTTPLASVPTAEPIKHGRWEKKGISIKGIEKEFCSECKTWSYGRTKAFCPNCGAKMGEVEG